MAPLIDVSDVNAFLDSKKSNLTQLEDALLTLLTGQVLGAVANRYSTDTWTNTTNTPLQIKRVIGMLYAGWHYLKIYSTDSEPSPYGEMLLANAQILLDNIISGVLVISSSSPTVTVNVTSGASIASELVTSSPKFSMDSEF